MFGTGNYSSSWAAPLAETPQDLLSVDRAQIHQNDSVHLVVLPLTSSPARLLTHTIDSTLSVEGSHLILDVRAAYRIHNPGRENLNMMIQVTPANTQASSPLPVAVALTVDGQPLTLQPTGEGDQRTAQITLGADGRRLLTLTYQLRLVEENLPAFRYPTNRLSAWAGSPESWRVTVQLPGESSGILPAESWVLTEPDEWTYTGSRLQWLKEGGFPRQPITFQFIHPQLWRDLSETRRLLSTQPSLDLFLHLGNLYNRLYRSPQVSDGGRRRFYAQALASYADGITYGQQIRLDQTDLAPLHRALTSLYRSRSIKADGEIDFAYVDLLVEEAQKTLDAFPAAEGRRAEVAQWLAEGLRLQLRRAQQANNWPLAFSLLERMANLPDDLIDPNWLDSERQMVQLQQALTLLDQDNEEAAVALAGDSIIDESLFPRPETRLIFASWQVTLTLQPNNTLIELATRPRPGREEIARQTFDQLAQAWQGIGAAGLQTQAQPDGSYLIQLSNVALRDRVALSQAIPPITDWALLRSLLVSVDPTIQRKGRLIWQDVEISQRVDLRPVADQWRGVGALLERQVAEGPQTTNIGQAQSIESAEAQIREQLRQIYLQHEAAAWQNLIRASTVHVEMQATQGDTGRTWIVQLTDPAQTVSFHTEVLSLARLLLAILSLLILILALAGILWLLL
ncbi:MAG: hypothetical protein KF893_13945 [Caldilineaceae bacterium]|nr:hypothetical protein [Caldilineaceae bacterium]